MTWSDLPLSGPTPSTCLALRGCGTQGIIMNSCHWPPYTPATRSRAHSQSVQEVGMEPRCLWPDPCCFTTVLPCSVLRTEGTERCKASPYRAQLVHHGGGLRGQGRTTWRVRAAGQTHIVHGVKPGAAGLRYGAQLLLVGTSSSIVKPAEGQRPRSPVPGTQPCSEQVWGAGKVTLEIAGEG